MACAIASQVQSVIRSGRYRETVDLKPLLARPRRGSWPCRRDVVNWDDPGRRVDNGVEISKVLEPVPDLCEQTSEV